jgi:hypothetical protein
MIKVTQIMTLIAAGLTLSACATTGSNPSYQSEGASRGTNAPESACMAAVNRQHGGKVRHLKVVSAECAESGCLVMVAADRERWRCFASRNGQVDELTLASGGATAPSSSRNPGSLVGMRARNMGDEMRRMGFNNVGGYKADGASFTTWWNAASRECVSIETRQGKVANAQPIDPGNCQ